MASAVKLLLFNLGGDCFATCCMGNGWHAWAADVLGRQGKGSQALCYTHQAMVQSRKHASLWHGWR